MLNDMQTSMFGIHYHEKFPWGIVWTLILPGAGDCLLMNLYLQHLQHCKFWRFSILVTPTGWSGWLWDLLLSWPLSASFTGQQQSTCLTDWFSSDSKSFIPHAIALYSLHICLARHHLMLTVYFKTVLSKHLTLLHLPTVCPLVFAMLLYYSQ